MDVQPIETRYSNHLFRSRLEARHAVLFDNLGLKWEYEPEGFKMGSIFYLPDFHLPGIGWVEVKGEPPTKQEINKAQLLSAGTNELVYISFGQLELPGCDGYTDTMILLSEAGWLDSQYWFCECPHCERIDIQFNGRADRIKCTCPKSSHGDKGYNFETPFIENAYRKAISARFELGKWL